MTDLLQLFVTSTDFSQPPEIRELAERQFADYFRDLFYSVEVARFLKNQGSSPRPPEPPAPIPDSVQQQLDNHAFLIRELLLHALGEPSPQPDLLSVLSEKRLRYAAAKEMLALFERAADEMRQIVDADSP